MLAIYNPPASHKVSIFRALLLFYERLPYACASSSKVLLTAADTTAAAKDPWPRFHVLLVPFCCRHGLISFINRKRTRLKHLGFRLLEAFLLYFQ